MTDQTRERTDIVAKQSERQWQQRLEGQLLGDIVKLRRKWERHFDKTTIPGKFLQFVDAVLRGINTEREKMMQRERQQTRKRKKAMRQTRKPSKVARQPGKQKKKRKKIKQKV